ncbi:transmembrane protein 267 [Zerene cesonia]|uniref:transmembrane protein 267 n=1 Tax=Zerene cesonia TaxID=33412 RepID=UPI0018E51CC9|nr:transmembrane protein 267 [Zerene cesonia]
MRSVRIFLSVSIFITAFIGDYLVFHSRYSNSFVYRALTDNFIHASIGFLSALLFFENILVTRQAWLYNVIFCTIVASLIDIDHFVVAKSIHIKDLNNLKHRGFLHCSSLWFAVTSILFLYSYLHRKLNIYILTFMLTIAYTSHHIRDANRRGLWFYPYGHTQPIPKYLYITVLSILPMIFVYVFQYFKPQSKDTVVQYSMLA